MTPLGLVVAAHQVLEWLSLQLHHRTEATAVLRLCIMELTTAVALAVLLHLTAHTAHLRRAEAVVLHPRRVEATGLLVRPQHKHNLVSRIQAAVEVVGLQKN